MSLFKDFISSDPHKDAVINGHMYNNRLKLQKLKYLFRRIGGAKHTGNRMPVANADLPNPCLVAKKGGSRLANKRMLLGANRRISWIVNIL